MTDKRYKYGPAEKHAYRPSPTGGCGDCGGMYDMHGHVLYRREAAEGQDRVTSTLIHQTDACIGAHPEGMNPGPAFWLTFVRPGYAEAGASSEEAKKAGQERVREGFGVCNRHLDQYLRLALQQSAPVDGKVTVKRAGVA